MAGRRLKMVPILALVFSALSFALPWAGKDGSIDVTVVDTGNRPIGGATVVLQGPMQVRTVSNSVPVPAQIMMPPETNATTDTSGHATFQGLASGQYSLRVQKDGYVGSATPRNTSLPSFVLTTVFIQEGQAPQQMELTLERGATISGKISNSKGSPVANARVYAGVVGFQNGRRTFQSHASAQTDDRGDFRLFWFGPGEYYIVCEWMQRSGPVMAPDFVRTFYPGTTEFEKSKPVRITGTDAAGINFKVQNMKTYRIHGKVIDLPSSPTGSRMLPTFTLAARDSNELDMPTSSSPPSRMNFETGEFELMGVAPGSWTLFATLIQPNVRSDPGRPNMPQYLGGRVSIDVRDKDVNDLQIAMFSVNIKGKVIFPKSGTAIFSGLPIQYIRVSLQPREGIPSFVYGATQSAPISNEGDFTFPGVPPGRYGISISAPGTIEDIQVGSKSIMNDGIINVGAESPDFIKIILAERTSGISGLVTGISPSTTVEQLWSTRVVLVPDPPRRQNTILYRSVELSGMRGNFFISSVPPGSYKIFAVEGLQQGAELDPAFIARYENRGVTIHVSDQGVNSIQVRWIRK